MMNALAVSYEANGVPVELDAQTVKNYLVNGNGEVTDQEVAMFINLCRYQGLNPFLREAYLIKYDSKAPASTVVGKDAFTRRASQIEECKGWSAGVAVVTRKNEYVEREGTIVLPEERLVGGWCEVLREGWEKPFKVSVNLSEYNTGKSMWAKMPATMIRKVAIVQGLRDAFPDKFQGMYDQSEMGTDGRLPETEIPQNPDEQTIDKAKKKAISELIGEDEERIRIAKKVVAGYGHSGIKNITNGDYEDIMEDLQAAFAEMEEETIDIDEMDEEMKAEIAEQEFYEHYEAEAEANG